MSWMEYVAQEDEFGCLIAAAAMVLDLTYTQVAKTVPLQDPEIFRQTGKNLLGVIALDRIEALALTRGKEMIDLGPPPFVTQDGLRYIAMVPAANHALAVDETGIAFDPAPVNEGVRKMWSEYDVLALLEFRPLERFRDQV